ncbi:uncharacterized protein C7orf78 homolog [Xenentodon cancila]
MSPVSSESKTKFSESRDFSARRKCLEPPKAESQRDLWSIKPSDLSVKLYSRLTESRKKQRKKPAKEAKPEGTLGTTGNYRAIIVHGGPEKHNLPKFIVSQRPPDALEAELMFVRTGKYPSGPYKNPRPHDFRPLDEDLPEISAACDRDPGNLNFKLKHLDTLRTTRSEMDFRSGLTKTRMDTYKPAEPKWDSALILPPLPWPPKSPSYTRHRRRRGAYAAFLDRVEEKLRRSWKK